MKYSDLIVEWLAELGYTHCFFLPGGNIMHLLESCSRKFECVLFVHEGAACMAAEYFNALHPDRKAFALVTAGPGVTNAVTAIAGAYLESRELLILAGQVKVADLARGEVRQRGIQEINGVELVRSITESATCLKDVVNSITFASLTRSGVGGRKGPVFLEIPLDIQARTVNVSVLGKANAMEPPIFQPVEPSTIEKIAQKLKSAKRPVILVGAGIRWEIAQLLLDKLADLGIPLMVTWNATDRVPANHPLYFGRPNIWGQRYSNILMQQADMLLALGSRLGLQQTGFNWREFIPKGEVIQVDCDPAELAKGHPRVSQPICGDANFVLERLAGHDLGTHDDWVAFCREVRRLLPVVEDVNETQKDFISPYVFMQTLSCLCGSDDIVIPCSSGGAFTVFMQVFAQKLGQRIISNKALASMGYGLSGAIGAAISGRERRTILIEGDGGVLQNVQELGTVAANKLNLKLFIFDNNGYASIRMTQRNYFGGRYIGCDGQTGLGIPIWKSIFDAYRIPMVDIGPEFQDAREFQDQFNARGPAAFLVSIDPEQTYYPKITSRITDTGDMVSNPLHIMSPDLDPQLAEKVLRNLRDHS